MDNCEQDQEKLWSPKGLPSKAQNKLGHLAEFIWEVLQVVSFSICP